MQVEVRLSDLCRQNIVDADTIVLSSRTTCRVNASSGCCHSEASEDRRTPVLTHRPDACTLSHLEQVVSRREESGNSGEGFPRSAIGGTDWMYLAERLVTLGACKSETS